MKTLILSSMIALFTNVLSHPADAGTVLAEETVFSKALRRDLPYSVYLPDGYEQQGATFPVLYLLHGFGGNHLEWLSAGQIETVLDQLIDNGMVSPMILIMPDAQNSWYVDSAKFGGPGNYESALIRDLLPEIDRRYPTRAEPSSRMIGGISMGGYGALRLGLGHPDLFSAVGALSPAIFDDQGISWRFSPASADPQTRLAWFGQTMGREFDTKVYVDQSPFSRISDGLAKNPEMRFWLGVGDDDDFNLQAGTLDFYLRLRELGQTPELRVNNGPHQWVLYNQLIPDMLMFLSRP